jgi:hypothetical protein
MNYKTILAVLGTAITMTSICSAQKSNPFTSNAPATSPDVFRVNYFVGLNAGASLGGGGTITSPEEYIDIVNPGTNGASGITSSAVGDVCALIYVVDTAEELQECCGCVVTPDQLIELHVQRDLLSNPNNPRVVHNGAIKIISSAPASGTSDKCNPGAPNPTPELREWITHVRNIPAVGAGLATVGVTEVEFSFADLSTGEESFLASACSQIQNGSTGSGVCSCPGTLPI